MGGAYTTNLRCMSSLHRRMVGLLTGSALVLLVAGCASAGATPVVGGDGPSPVVETLADPVGVGVTQTTTSGAQVTVYGTQGVTRIEGDYSFLPAGVSNTGVDVQVCVPGGTTVQSLDRWALTDAANGRYASVTAHLPLKPEYPFTPVPAGAGECVRGWVMFETKDGTPITGVRYAVADGSVLRWTVS